MRQHCIFLTLFIFYLGLAQPSVAGQVSNQAPRDHGQKTDRLGRGSSLEEQILLKIYQLFYAEGQEVREKDETWLKAFLFDLDEIDKKRGYDGDPETLLMCRAEIYFQQGFKRIC